MLSALSDVDRDSLIAIFKDDRVKCTYMVPDLDEETADRLFERLKKLSHSSDRIVLGIYLENELIGLINDTGIDDGAVELGWVISPAHHNCGYATEAVKAVIEKLLADGFREIVAGAFSENPASIRVMEKCSMTRIDKEETIEYRGISHRCVYYSIKK